MHIRPLKRIPRLSRLASLLLLAGLLLPAACRSPQVKQEITVTVQADGKTQSLLVDAGSTVTQALKTAGKEIGDLDRVTPPSYEVLKDGDTILLVRVSETFETQQQVLPFERQIVRNESLPEGETRLLQPGTNGLQEITYRSVLEDGQEMSQTPVKTVLLQEAQPEIVMVGVQAAFAPVEIPGSIAYLAGGNAWLMEGSTASRRLLVASGDLDGRIFSLSPKGDWLLFTRKSKLSADKQINTLWAVNTTNANPKPIDLGVANVVHFAGWVPGQITVVSYSTVEPRTTAPGWQANNDFYILDFGESGWIKKPEKIIDSNSGGIYGWWGTTYAWSADGKRLVYARPDGLGLVDLDAKVLKPLLDITPLQTRSDWAWVPGLAWGGDNDSLYFVNHAPPPSLIAPEESPYFDLQAASLANGASVRLVEQAGMFAYPAAGPARKNASESSYLLAYLQAVFPAQSETSRYRLVVMDRDGSNRQVLFPPPDSPGLEPQTPVWAPQRTMDQPKTYLGLIYQGDLWLVDPLSGAYSQITGDGLISRIDWK